ncbi:nucleoside-diphosphate-sugar epimerase [Chthonomonas calidirosea]|uniref:Nucleoside-diphosphate-sugar epimerases n=1 Tax=Chthonomonas calidirosea (strain DSM 23976 / ICMP 18418 / T49) TaxID=1303518 RepID=S0EYM8_CHTCT|nr:Nucleoside-diphosphate-sugar epimerases [Chthonomonas calidirosea T49]CEK19988.1 nucleoside-diphosphate-sugar epimerase [Chthonomonas calidirosea]
MRVLVTGSEGFIGQAQVAALLEAGHEVRTFDQRSARQREWEHIPGDIRDIYALRKAVQGMDAIVHLAAIPNDRHGGEADVLDVNVRGTLNVLIAAHEAEIGRVVFYSSINAIGCVGRFGKAHYLPVDDFHPHHPMTPYQLSKHLGEEACRSYSERYGIVTACLRPTFVTREDHYSGHWFPAEEGRWPSYSIELFAYVDVRDVCQAGLLALTAQGFLHAGFLLTADDTGLPIPTEEAVKRFFPDHPWQQDRTAYLAENPYRSLVDCSQAKCLLGWQPKHSWRNYRSNS